MLDIISAHSELPMAVLHGSFVREYSIYKGHIEVGSFVDCFPTTQDKTKSNLHTPVTYCSVFQPSMYLLRRVAGLPP